MLPHLLLARAIKTGSRWTLCWKHSQRLGRGRQYWFREEAILDAYGATHMAALTKR